ncbi:integrase [Streptomyces sp. KM273126]|uniref:integrase n=1 Tax=Streptomyces sp. KM273126 TaxID=2545247 RepID=UPI0026CF35AA
MRARCFRAFPASGYIKVVAECLAGYLGLTLRLYAHLMPSSQERTRKGKAVAAVFDTAQPEPSRT